MVISAIMLFRSLKTQLRSFILLPTLQEYQHFSTELTNKEKRNVSFTITLKTQTNLTLITINSERYLDFLFIEHRPVLQYNSICFISF